MQWWSEQLWPFVVSLGLFWFWCWVFVSAVRMRYYLYLSRQLAKETVPFTRGVHGERRRMRILVIGDSTAVGVGASMPETSLAGLLGARYPHAEVVNVARTGATTAQTLRQFRRVHGDFSVIMLNVGGNDTLWGVPYEAIRKHLRALLRAAKKRAPIIIVTGTGDVGILPFLPILLRWYMSYRTRVVQQIFAEETTAAGTGVIFVELFRTPCDAPFVHAPRDHFAYDLSHPNDAGYAALYGCIAASLSRLGK